MLENIKILTGNTDEQLIQVLIDKTIKEIESYGKTYDSTLDNLIEDIVIFKMNRLGHEGVTSHNTNGVTENFATSYPDYIVAQFDALGVKVPGKGWAKML